MSQYLSLNKASALPYFLHLSYPKSSRTVTSITFTETLDDSSIGYQISGILYFIYYQSTQHLRSLLDQTAASSVSTTQNTRGAITPDGQTPQS